MYNKISSHNGWFSKKSKKLLAGQFLTKHTQSLFPFLVNKVSNENKRGNVISSVQSKGIIFFITFVFYFLCIIALKTVFFRFNSQWQEIAIKREKFISPMYFSFFLRVSRQSFKYTYLHLSERVDDIAASDVLVWSMNFQDVLSLLFTRYEKSWKNDKLMNCMHKRPRVLRRSSSLSY